MSTPMLRGLKERVEGAELHYLCNNSYAELLSNNPNVEKVHILNSELDITIDDLLVEDFDYIIDLQLDSYTHRLKQKLPVMSFEYDALNFKQWLYVNFKWNRLPDLHLVDRYYDTATLFDVENDNKSLDFFIPEKDEVDPKIMHSAFEGKYMMVSLDAAFETRNIPNEKLAAIINMAGVPVCLVGAKLWNKKGQDLEALLKVPFLNTIDKININQAASLISQSALILSPDSDYIHIASAFQKPILSLWGNTVPAFGKTPYLSNEQSALFEVNHLRCRPCSKKGFESCPKKHFKCMHEIDNAAIINKITSIIK